VWGVIFSVLGSGFWILGSTLTGNMAITHSRLKKSFGVIIIVLTFKIGCAQPTNLGPTPVIAGIQCQCFGIHTILVPTLNDLAMADPNSGILLGPLFFSAPPGVQLFTYAHECSHFMPEIGANENAADCNAAKVGRIQGWLTLQGIDDFCGYFANNPGNWSHSPGAIRCQNVINCYNNP
jgi:hypothetical protein